MSTRSTLDQMVAGILQAAGMDEFRIEETIKELSRQRDMENIATTIGGHPINYWHKVATGAMKTNDELITNLRERTREREEMEDKMEAKERSLEHLRGCNRQILKERDQAVKEADDLRTKLIHLQRQMDLAKTALLNA